MDGHETEPFNQQPDKLAAVRVHGNAGVGLAENIMSGTVVVDGAASRSAGATGHGGLASIVTSWHDGNIRTSSMRGSEARMPERGAISSTRDTWCLISYGRM